MPRPPMEPNYRARLNAALTETEQLMHVIKQLLNEVPDASNEVALIRAQQILFYLTPQP